MEKVYWKKGDPKENMKADFFVNNPLSDGN